MSDPVPCAEILADARLAALRLDGADRLDPVRFHYLEALAQRTCAQQDGVKRILDGKLNAEVSALRTRLEQARSNAGASLAAPGAAAPQRETLADLVRRMAHHTPSKTDSEVNASVPIASRDELKSVRYFRNTWSKLSAEKQAIQSLGQAPKNAGPINSHMVALRSLALMRDTSPDYLNRFMCYVDTLLLLDQGDRLPAPVAKTSRALKPKPKPKP